MKNKIYPCFWFDNQAQEAAKLYLKAFGDGKIQQESQLVVDFELFGQRFMGLNGGPEFKINPSISLFVTLDNEQKVNKAWETLIKGGQELMPFDTYPWAKKYGWLQDKFGLSWQISFSEHHQFDQIICPAFMFIGKNVGKTEEAMKWYTSLFPNSKIFDTVHYEEQDGDNTEYIKHGRFSLDGNMFIAMDSSFDHKFKLNEGVSLVVSCDGQKEVDFYWEKLTAGGGEESMCGWVKDKYGVSWQIVPIQLIEALSNPDQEKAKHAMDAMLKMKKIIIRDL